MNREKHRIRNLKLSFKGVWSSPFDAGPMVFTVRSDNRPRFVGRLVADISDDASILAIEVEEVDWMDGCPGDADEVLREVQSECASLVSRAICYALGSDAHTLGCFARVTEPQQAKPIH